MIELLTKLTQNGFLVKNIYKIFSYVPKVYKPILSVCILMILLISHIINTNELSDIKKQLSFLSLKFNIGNNAYNKMKYTIAFEKIIESCHPTNNKFIPLLGTYQIIDNSHIYNHKNLPVGVRVHKPEIFALVWSNKFLKNGENNLHRILRTDFDNKECILEANDYIQDTNIKYNKNIVINDINCIKIKKALQQDLQYTNTIKPKYLSYFTKNTKDYRLSEYTYNLVFFLSEHPIDFVSRTCENGMSLNDNIVHFLNEYDLNSFL